MRNPTKRDTNKPPLLCRLAAAICLPVVLAGAAPPPLPLDAYSDQVMAMDALWDGRYPEYTQDGVWQFRKQVNWLSGFIAGEHWILYDLTGKEEHRQRAIAWTDQLLPSAGIDRTHDMGFIFLPSAGMGYSHTGDPRYREALAEAAEMLARRYNPHGRFLRAWGRLGSDEDRAGWMIIDTLMNLELLFTAAEELENPEWYRVAYAHALTTLREAVREDGSTCHVVEFDPRTGAVIRKRTHQGAGDDTTWARGQAWAIYGFATAFQHTGDQRFLRASVRAADYFTRQLAATPADWVPAWDLSLQGDPTAAKDASAAAIAANGLYLLAGLTDDPQAVDRFRAQADAMVRDLVDHHTFLHSARDTEQGLLLHTVYHHHKQWGVDESFPAGDYYFLLALQRHVASTDRHDLGRLLATPGRRRASANAGWAYRPSEAPPEQATLVDLPHTWNAFDVVDAEPGYRRDRGVYQKSVFVPAALGDRRLRLDIEAANTVAEVFVNDRRAGGHIGGYLGFRVDLTPYLQLDATNHIRIEVANAIDPDVIPSQKSDFFIYGGLTRDVWFDVAPATSLDRILIRTPEVSAETARVEVEPILVGPVEPGSTIEVVLHDPDGQIRARQEFPVAGAGTVYRLDPVATPALWSPDAPRLYSLEVRLRRGTTELDRLSERFGFRWYEFVEGGPFLLNGERLLLRGTHRHEEWAGYGNAMPNELHRRDMEMIKAMGANFVRLAHYPQDPEVYRACDELGLLVWDELPWCRGGAGHDAWRANTRRMLQEMIRQNYNHPAIILWSLGNEMYWLPDVEGGDDVDTLRTELAALNAIAHELDPSRPTAIRKFYEGADIVDVFSPSIWAGWYSGVYRDYPKAIRDSQAKYPRFLHVEYGGSSHVGRHDESPITGEGMDIADGWEEAVNQTRVKNVAQVGDWSENYIVDLFDYHLQVSETAGNFTGNAQWAFKDFGTPLRPENAIPYMNQKGLVDREGNPKDAYYVFKSYWTTHPPFCYIESPTWTDRSGPAGKARTIAVFANCDEVELMANGKSLGRKTRSLGQAPAQGLNWEYPFAEGTNQLEAVGFDEAGAEVARHRVTVNYTYRQAGKPADVQLRAENLSDGNLMIIATVVDGNGQRCLDYNRRMYFSHSGAGDLAGDLGTPTGSRTIECASGEARIRYRPVPGEPAVIEARNQDFKGAYLPILGPLPTRYQDEGQ